MSLTQEIESRIQRFVTELNELVRKQALQAVSDALGTQPAPRRAASSQRPGRPAKAPASNGASAPVAAGGGPRRRSRKKGEKRTQAELAALERALASYVQSNPGKGIEAIGKALGYPTSELSRPMKKLVQRGAIRTEGEKRATKYYGGSAGAAKAAGSEAGAAGATTKARAGRKAAGRKRSKKR